MTLLGAELLDEFVAKHREAGEAFAVWRISVVSASPRHFIELKQTFAGADYVKPFVVFDVGGNKYRLIALVDYASRILQIRHVLTHAEYGRRDWRR